MFGNVQDVADVVETPRRWLRHGSEFVVADHCFVCIALVLLNSFTCCWVLSTVMLQLFPDLKYLPPLKVIAAL
jgi:hypothetical protein